MLQAKKFRPVLLTTKTQMCLPNINKLSTYRDNTFLVIYLKNARRINIYKRIRVIQYYNRMEKIIHMKASIFVETVLEKTPMLGKTEGETDGSNRG